MFYVHKSFFHIFFLGLKEWSQLTNHEPTRHPTDPSVFLVLFWANLIFGGQV